MERNTFIKMSALVMLAPLGNSITARSILAKRILFTDDIFERAITANDKQVDGLLQTVSVADFNFGRKAAADFATLTASYCFLLKEKLLHLKAPAKMQYQAAILNYQY